MTSKELYNEMGQLCNELFSMPSWFFVSGSGGNGTKYQNLNGNGNKNINTREWELTIGNGRGWEY